MPSTQNSAQAGLSDQLTMGIITQLVESEEVAFRVAFNDVLPAAEQLYWRGPIFWHTDGHQWLDIDPNMAALPDEQPFQSLQFSGKPVNYTVTLQPHQKSWLFALDLPATTPEIAFQRFDYQLVAKNPITDVIRYSITSYPQYITREPQRFLRTLCG